MVVPFLENFSYCFPNFGRSCWRAIALSVHGPIHVCNVHALSIALLSQNARRAYDKVLSPRICRCIFMILRCPPWGYFRELPVVLADATNPISSTALRHRVLCTSIVISLSRQLQIESYYPMTTTPCGSPVYSYSNTWDLAISTILEEPTIYVGPRTFSLHS